MTKGKMMLVVMGLAVLVLVAVTACSQSSAAGSKAGVTAKQVTINAQTDGSMVSVPVSDIEKNVNTRFLVTTATSKMYFMAYQYNNQDYVRADICPPCGSQSFTLTNGTLVCDSCGTVFDAATGAGIRGACVIYGKKPVQFQTTAGNMVMNQSDLLTAYQNTIKPR